MISTPYGNTMSPSLPFMPSSPRREENEIKKVGVRVIEEREQ
jgi:hypothetical protein